MPAGSTDSSQPPPSWPAPSHWGRLASLCLEWLLEIGTFMLGSLSYRTWFLIRPLLAHDRRRNRGRNRLIVIAGSLGKTDTTRAIHRVLTGETEQRLHRLENSFSFAAWTLVKQWRRSKLAVLEVGIGGPGHMTEYSRVLCPDLVVMTAIASDHLRNFRDQEHLWHEKSRLIAGLDKSAIAILNADDSQVMRMASLTRARIVTFGWEATSDVAIRRCTPTDTGSEVELQSPLGRLVLRTGFLSRHQARSLTAAVAVGWCEGLSRDQIEIHLAGLSATPGRLQSIPLGRQRTALCDDFKGGLETFESALETWRHRPARRRLAVLGSLYQPPLPVETFYASLAQAAAAQAAHLVLVGQDARFYAAALAKLPGAPPHDVVATVEEAVHCLESVLQPGDLLLIKGRGEQKLKRIALLLAGVDVRCHLRDCALENVLCDECPIVRGWRCVLP